MGYKLDDKNVLMAVDHIIKDVDKKFDECLVDKFLEFIESELGPSKQWIQDTKAIVDRLDSFINHKAFVMLNQARAFKIVYSILKTRHLTEAELKHVSPLLNSVWNSLGMIILNTNLSAMTVMLCILEHMILFKSGYLWIIENKIEPPLKLTPSPGYEIKDVSSLARYYLETSNNYHTRNRAEKFFESLVVNSIIRDIPSNHPQTLAIKQTIRELTLGGSTSIVCILINILKNISKLKIDRMSLFERYEILEVIQESFLNLIERPKINMNNLCKCLALTNSSQNFGTIFEKLKSKNHLEGIIVYLSNSRSRNSEFNQLSLTYLLYPLLTKCNGEDTQMLVKRLLATRDERDFIDKNMSDRLVTLCLVQLKHIFDDKLYSNHFSSRSLILILNTLANYVKCHIGIMQSYKNVMECCSVIEELQHLSGLIVDSSVVPLLQQSPDSIHDIIETIQYDSDHTKPILLKLLKVLRRSHRSLSNLIIFMEKTHSDLLKTMELAFRFKDHDIMNEFAMFYILNSFSFILEAHDVDRYVELVWDHMYMNARETDHRELLGNLAHLLIEIDLEVPASILEKHNIKRNHDIPKLLGDILIERSAIIPTVKLTVDALISTCSLSEDLSTTVGYLCRLDSPTLPKTVKIGLDHLALGLCATVRGEADDDTRSEVLKVLIDLMKEMVTNSDDAEQILTRLARNGILETLYDVVTGSMYPRMLYINARPRIGFIKSGVIQKLMNANGLIVKKLLSCSDGAKNNDNFRQRMSKAQSIADFYSADQEYFREEEDSPTQVGDKMALYSLVDDILNYELISDGISDCY